MKKYIRCLLFCIGSLQLLQAQNTFNISGQLDNKADAVTVKLYFKKANKSVMDSAQTKAGTFAFTNSVEEPTKARIVIEPSKHGKTPLTYQQILSIDEREFFLEPGTIKIIGSNLKTAAIKGGKTQAEYLVLEAEIQRLQQKADTLTNLFMQEKDEKERTAIGAKLQTARQAINKIKENYIYTHADSYVTLDLVQARATLVHVPTFEPLYNSLSERMKNTPAGKKMAAKLALERKIAIGQPAIGFTQNTVEDAPFSLSALKGKYVLIDFWASWCGPCRQENPYLVKAYEQFRNSNFEIVSVSLDDKKAPWVEAIKKDGLPWIHISDLKGWKNDIAVEYGISMVPQSFLLNPEGIIIARNIQGKLLDQKLQDLLKKQ